MEKVTHLIESTELDHSARYAELARANVALETELSEQKRRAAELAASEARFRLITESTADLVAIVDRDGKRIYNSPSYQTVLGYSPDELKTTWAFEQIHPDDRPFVMQAAETTWRTGSGKQIKYRIRHKSGSWRTLESRGTAVRNEQGEIINLIVTARDVTEQERAAAALKVTHERLAELDTLHKVTSRAGWQAYRAKAGPEQTGYLFDQTNVKPLSYHRAEDAESFLSDQFASGDGSATAPILSTPIALRGEVIGSLGVIDDPAYPLGAADSEFVAAISSQIAIALENARLFQEAQAARDEMEERVLDRTAELSHANTRLTQQNAFMAALHDTALSLMNRPDLSEVLHSIVARAASLSGTRNGYVYLLTPGETEMMMQIGTGLFERRVGERIRRNQGIAGAAWQSGQALSVPDYLHWPARVPDPVADQMRAHIAVPLISGDYVVGILGLGHEERDGAPIDEPAMNRVLQFAELATIALDNARLYAEAQQELAERKRVERQLEVARDQAVEASRLKSEFLANMSHEIRTPMNAVVGMTGLLTGSKLDSRQRYFVDTIRSSSDALLTIINDILDLSKMEAGKLTLENIEFQPLASVEEAAELLAPRAREKNLALMTFVSPEIPAVLRGDPIRLQQILLNLTGNALKFTERGQVVVAASLESESQTHVVIRFAVTDTGIGLSPEAHERIFEPFTQADGSTTRKYGGTGLGLSISRRLTELMNGEIHVESEEGKGSTFWFTARFEKVALDPDDRGFALTRALADARILVVDESQASREFLHRYLAAWGMRDSVTSDANEALAMLRRAATAHEAYDAMIVDLILTGSDAFTIAKQVQQEPLLVGTKLVLLTAFDEQGLGQRAIDSGFAAYLVKPVKQSQLFDTIAQVMGEQAGPRKAAPQQPTPIRKSAPSFLDGKVPEDALILIAEDHPVNKEVAILQLQQLGLRAHAVSNGQEALGAIARTRYTLVLMDCQMPELDGYEATRLIRRGEAGTGRHLPIIAMTAHAMQGDREMCLAAGMDDYISKPVSLEKLQAMLRNWMPRTRPGTAMADSPSASASQGHLEDAQQGPVDRSVIEELKAMQGDDHEFMNRLIGTYFAQTDQLLKNMRAAVVSGDSEALRQSAHKLKGGSAVLGVKNLSSLCYDLELQARSGSLDGAVDKVALAETEYVSVHAALQRELPGGGA